MYVVFNMTNYGQGFQFEGCYRSYDKAVKRREWCEEHTIDPDNDSWYIIEVRAKGITEGFSEC